VTGRRVRTLAAGTLAAGPHDARWDGDTEGGRACPAGLYFVRLSVDGVVRSKRVVLER